MRSEATAFTGWYDALGASVSRSSHDGVKSVVEEVVRDMGFRECELDNKLEVIEALLGDDGRQLSEGEAHEGTTLRETIEDELEMREDNIHCHFQMLQSRLHDEVRLQLPMGRDITLTSVYIVPDPGGVGCK
jgi:hypothetical protein